MRFIVDHQLPPAVARWLGGLGHEAEHVWRLGMGEAGDHDIWHEAVRRDAAIISKDSDFAERRARVREGPTIVWLRVGNTTTTALIHWLEQRWDKIETAIRSGASLVEVR